MDVINQEIDGYVNLVEITIDTLETSDHELDEIYEDFVERITPGENLLTHAHGYTPMSLLAVLYSMGMILGRFSTIVHPIVNALTRAHGSDNYNNIREQVRIVRALLERPPERVAQEPAAEQLDNKQTEKLGNKQLGNKQNE
jgi:hypothetical protein